MFQVEKRRAKGSGLRGRGRGMSFCLSRVFASSHHRSVVLSCCRSYSLLYQMNSCNLFNSCNPIAIGSWTLFLFNYSINLVTHSTTSLYRSFAPSLFVLSLFRTFVPSFLPLDTLPSRHSQGVNKRTKITIFGEMIKWFKGDVDQLFLVAGFWLLVTLEVCHFLRNDSGDQACPAG